MWYTEVADKMAYVNSADSWRNSLIRVYTVPPKILRNKCIKQQQKLGPKSVGIKCSKMSDIYRIQKF